MSTKKRKCMVLMPFAQKFEEVYTQIFQPACRSQDVECWRADERAVPGSITSDIVEGILEADLIIADLTGQNTNVFYELGIAHTLNKHVITVCQNLDDVPFDIRSYRVLRYSQSISGAAALRTELERVMGELLTSERLPGNPVQDAMRLREKQLGSGGLAHEGRSSTPASPFETRIQEVLIDKAVSEIAAAVERITSPSGEYDSVAIIGPDGIDILLRFTIISPGHLIADAMIATYNEGYEWISERQIQKLNEFGWYSVSEVDWLPFQRDFRNWSLKDEYDFKLIALEAVQVLSEVYNVKKLDAITIEIQLYLSE